MLRWLIFLTFYPSWWFSRLMHALRVWRPWDWVEDGVLLGVVPTRGELARLKALGISSIVNLCAEFRGHERLLADLGLTQLRLPTLDYHCPSREDLLRGVAYIRDERAAGRKVYVHCKAGRGRSAALILCYLIASRRISAAKAFEIIRAARPQVTRSILHYPTLNALQPQLLQQAAVPAPHSPAPS